MGFPDKGFTNDNHCLMLTCSLSQQRINLYLNIPTETEYTEEYKRQEESRSAMLLVKFNTPK